ncbi:hypothetical protein [Streptomyces sp. CEV 2-1]|uniref:hypothetical protein n=1 Tax=Streptomyces sp. CEV 2-1 TaxID=2485153 RepID=UPI00160B170C|nr:hypothetical protein [Streptomyces sp. CEV 2-1]
MSVDATGIPALDAVLVWGGVASVVTAVGTVLWRITRGVLHLSRRVEEFMDDWAGAEERPGVPGRPGVMARLGGFEDRMTRVEHELYPNSGGSLRDAVDLANQRLALMCPDPDEEPPPPPAPPSAATS